MKALAAGPGSQQSSCATAAQVVSGPSPPPSVRHQTAERETASRRFAGMTSAPKSKPASPKLRYWRVSVPGGKRPEYVGIVEAPDQQSAEATAVKRFRLTDEERERLVVRTRD
jgi:hypothetical protein